MQARFGRWLSQGIKKEFLVFGKVLTEEMGER